MGTDLHPARQPIVFSREVTDPDELRLGGWGFLDVEPDLNGQDEAVWKWLADKLGREYPFDVTPAPGKNQFILVDSRIQSDELELIEGIVRPGAIFVNPNARLRYSLGQSYHDLIRFRQGTMPAVVDAVVFPGNHEQTVALLSLAAAHGWSVVPIGGATSVVGGVNTPIGSDRPVLAIVMTRCAGLHDLDQENRIATVGAGTYGPALEHALTKRGYTLGHFPQSFEFSTVGGWIAAAGAGQNSLGYGRADQWLAGATVALPDGEWTSDDVPASAAGPTLRRLLIGSEGRLGIITRAEVRVRPVPEDAGYRAYLCKSFKDGCKFARQLTRSCEGLSLLRVSDEDETRFQRQFASQQRTDSLFKDVFKSLLKMRGYERPALVIVGTEGSRKHVGRVMDSIGRVVRRTDVAKLGMNPAESWLANRFSTPYLRDAMLDRGVGVDTLETSGRWSQLSRLHLAVTRALRKELGDDAIVMAHLSHSYPDGASLYFTYVFNMADDPIAQWHKVKTAASEAITIHGGTISHHHGVGEDHRQWVGQEKDATELALLRSIARQLDPGEILNPGKLIP